MKTIDLVIKCHKYHKYGNMRQDALTRYCIGYYQLGQGAKWGPQSNVVWQSYAAAAMHFIMCADALGLPIESHLPAKVGQYQDTMPDWFVLSTKTLQQLVYAKHSEGSNRKSRYNKDKTVILLAQQAEGALGRVPPSLREQTMADEWRILTGDIGR